MKICNIGGDLARGDYRGETFRGRSSEALDRGVTSRSGEVQAYPRQSAHVWNLVARMLKAMGYE
jgi:hypothetical protein